MDEYTWHIVWYAITKRINIINAYSYNNFLASISPHLPSHASVGTSSHFIHPVLLVFWINFIFQYLVWQINLCISPFTWNFIWVLLANVWLLESTWHFRWLKIHISQHFFVKSRSIILAPSPAKSNSIFPLNIFSNYLLFSSLSPQSLSHNYLLSEWHCWNFFLILL